MNQRESLVYTSSYYRELSSEQRSNYSPKLVPDMANCSGKASKYTDKTYTADVAILLRSILHVEMRHL